MDGDLCLFFRHVVLCGWRSRHKSKLPFYIEEGREVWSEDYMAPLESTRLDTTNTLEIVPRPGGANQ